MELKIIFLSLFFIFIQTDIISQDEQLKAIYAKESQNAIKKLTIIDQSSSNFLTQLDQITHSYCTYKIYAPENAETIFELISDLKNNLKYEYYRFVYVNKDCFSEQEIKNVRNNLESLISSKGSWSYQLMSMYKIEKHEFVLREELDSNLFREIEEQFKKGYGTTRGKMEKIQIHTTLANLGDTLLEDSIISFVNRLYDLCQTEPDDGKKERLMLDFFVWIVPWAIGGLNSKESVLKTLHISTCNYEWRSVPDDAPMLPPFEAYIYGVVSPKITRYERAVLQQNLYSLDDKDEKYNYVQTQIERIKNDEMDWKYFD